MAADRIKCKSCCRLYSSSREKCPFCSKPQVALSSNSAMQPAPSPSRVGHAALILGIFLAFLFVWHYAVPLFTRHTAQKPPQTLPVARVQQPAKRAAPAVEVKRHLGYKTLTFGSTTQASTLLDLIRAKPDRERYTISYQTDDDIVFFGCDLRAETLLRMHQKRRIQRGTTETWSYYVLYRLKSTATGGSLNDTPQGKSPARFTTFWTL